MAPSGPVFSGRARLRRAKMIDCRRAEMERYRSPAAAPTQTQSGGESMQRAGNRTLHHALCPKGAPPRQGEMAAQLAMTGRRPEAGPTHVVICPSALAAHTFVGDHQRSQILLLRGRSHSPPQQDIQFFNEARNPKLSGSEHDRETDDFTSISTLSSASPPSPAAENYEGRCSRGAPPRRPHRDPA